MIDNDGPFSLNDFKKWMSEQKENLFKRTSKASDLVGHVVESKLSLKKLITKMDPDQGYLQEMAKEFRQHGGTILEIEQNNLLVEVRSGTFRIPKFFVRILSKPMGDGSY